MTHHLTPFDDAPEPTPSTAMLRVAFGCWLFSLACVGGLSWWFR